MLENRQVLNLSKIAPDTIVVATINGLDKVMSRDQILARLGQKRDRKAKAPAAAAPPTPPVKPAKST